MHAAYEHQNTTRELDGTLFVFQRYEDLWMIDRAEVANDCEAECDDTDDKTSPCGLGGSTAVARHEVMGLSEIERRHYLSRQLRRLGLPTRGHGSRLLWRMITNFERFSP
jgi:hypothetical protein